MPEGYESDDDLPEGAMKAFVVRQEESPEIALFIDPVDKMVDAWMK